MAAYYGGRVGEEDDEQIKRKDFEPSDGYTIYWFRCNEKIEGENFHRGQIRCGFNSLEDCCFFTLDKFDCAEDAFQYCELSHKYNIPFVLKCKGLGLSKSRMGEDDNRNIFVALELFDASFDTKWIDDNSDKCSDGNWWRRQMKNILGAFNKMNLNNVTLRELIFLVRGGDLHLMNVRLFGNKGLSKEKLFGNFVSENAESCFKLNPDWDHFKKSFAYSTANQLLKHPFLQTSLERFYHYRQINDYDNHCMTVDQRNVFVREVNSSTTYSGWQSKLISDTMLLRILNYKDPTAHTKHKFPYELLEFIGNFFDHQTHGRNRPLLTPEDRAIAASEEIIITKEDEEKKIAATFPGFLSNVHGVLTSKMKTSRGSTAKNLK